jgi:peptide/nickel transport system ATP-binding protein
VPQDPSAALNPTLRIGAQLKEALKVHGIVNDTSDRIVEVLGEAHLDSSPEFLRRYPHQLSGGQQQRLVLAMGFSCRPSLIVLDEPTTGLDVTTQRHILDTVRSLCRSHGAAAVYVSHDLAVVSGLVANVAVMYAGRVIELGATDQVFGFPAHPYTRGLLAAVPSPDRAEMLAGVEGQPPRPGRRPNGCSFAPRCAFVVDACRRTTPEPINVDGRLVRCIRITDLESEAGSRPPLPTAPTTPSSKTILSVRGLNASYGSSAVLFDLDIDFESETCVAVVGESGSGKTTLARCIAGLHRNWTGGMRFDGGHLAAGANKRPKAVLKRIQYIFQNPYTSLNPRKTISQIVSQPLESFASLSFAERSERTIRALQDVSLGPDYLSRFPDQLSGGERQRVAIARALIVEPDLLVCDEVTSALDVSVQAVIVELLRRLQREHRLGMIFITHNLALVRSVAQRVVVLSAGHVVEAGPVDEVLERPAHPYTARLIADVPRLADTRLAPKGFRGSGSDG